MHGVRLRRHPYDWPVVQRVARRTLDAKVAAPSPAGPAWSISTGEPQVHLLAIGAWTTIGRPVRR